MNRKKSIQTNLKNISEDIKIIEKEYQKAILDKNISELFTRTVKHCMYEFRECLDYSANDINDKFSPTNSNNIYFPYGKNENDFKSFIGRSFPNLNSNSSDVYGLVENLQPYKCGSDWLLNLCNLTNQIKHDKPAEQERKGTTNYELGGVSIVSGLENAGSITISGTTVENEGSIFKQTDDIIIRDNQLQFEMKEGKIASTVNFEFKDTGIDVLELIKTAHTSISKFIDDLYKII